VVRKPRRKRGFFIVHRSLPIVQFSLSGKMNASVCSVYSVGKHLNPTSLCLCAFVVKFSLSGSDLGVYQRGLAVVPSLL
jgi:hypothetical protein